MFRGNHQTRVDEKGRLKVPAGFKRLLDENYPSTKYYITSLDGQAARIYPMDEWERTEAKVKSTNQNNPYRNKWIRTTSYYGQEVEIDGQGRLLIPALLRDKAELKGDVDVLGMAEYLEVKNHEVLRNQVEENPFTDDDAQALSELG